MKYSATINVHIMLIHLLYVWSDVIIYKNLKTRHH